MEYGNLEGHRAGGSPDVKASAHCGIGKSQISFEDLKCPCCGDLHLNHEFWSRFDQFAALYNPVIKIGYICWDKARAEYAQRRRKNGRYRLSGTWERLLRGYAFVIEGDVKDWVEIVATYGLVAQEFEGAVEIMLEEAKDEN